MVRENARIPARLSLKQSTEGEWLSRHLAVIGRYFDNLDKNTLGRSALVVLPGGVKEPRSPSECCGASAACRGNGIADSFES